MLVLANAPVWKQGLYISDRVTIMMTAVHVNFNVIDQIVKTKSGFGNIASFQPL